MLAILIFGLGTAVVWALLAVRRGVWFRLLFGVIGLVTWFALVILLNKAMPPDFERKMLRQMPDWQFSVGIWFAAAVLSCVLGLVLAMLTRPRLELGGRELGPRASVNGPALSLMLTAGIGAILQAASALWTLVIIGMIISEGGHDVGSRTLGVGVGLVFNVLSLSMAVVVFLGSSKMRTLQSYGFAMTAAIIALVPLLSPCFVLGIPFGIWAIVVLRKPEVKAAFANGSPSSRATAESGSRETTPIGGEDSSQGNAPASPLQTQLPHGPRKASLRKVLVTITVIATILYLGVVVCLSLLSYGSGHQIYWSTRGPSSCCVYTVVFGNALLKLETAEIMHFEPFKYHSFTPDPDPERNHTGVWNVHGNSYIASNVTLPGFRFLTASTGTYCIRMSSWYFLLPGVLPLAAVQLGIARKRMVCHVVAGADSSAAHVKAIEALSTNADAQSMAQPSDGGEMIERRSPITLVSSNDHGVDCGAPQSEQGGVSSAAPSLDAGAAGRNVATATEVIAVPPGPPRMQPKARMMSSQMWVLCGLATILGVVALIVMATGGMESKSQRFRRELSAKLTACNEAGAKVKDGYITFGDLDGLEAAGNEVINFLKKTDPELLGELRQEGNRKATAQIKEQLLEFKGRKWLEREGFFVEQWIEKNGL